MTHDHDALSYVYTRKVSIVSLNRPLPISICAVIHFYNFCHFHHASRSFIMIFFDFQDFCVDLVEYIFFLIFLSSLLVLRLLLFKMLIYLIIVCTSFGTIRLCSIKCAHFGDDEPKNIQFWHIIIFLHNRYHFCVANFRYGCTVATLNMVD